MSDIRGSEFGVPQSGPNRDLRPGAVGVEAAAGRRVAAGTEAEDLSVNSRAAAKSVVASS